MVSFLRVLLSVSLLVAAAGKAIAATVVVLTVNGAINPGTADYVVRGLSEAASRQAQLVVLKMDTPGGLDLSMRSIIKGIVASEVPVCAFVAPEGARAASAGTYILYASHIAAMASATNLGAATPVAIGIGAQPGRAPPASAAKGAGESTEERKQVNDAAAYIRSLAQLRGRNQDWAELAVRQAVSLSASEALKINVIDLIANDVPDLVRQIDGRRVQLPGGERILHLSGAKIVSIDPDRRSRILSVISDPSIAYLLLLAGVFGLFFEFSNPGFVLPGAVGAISLLLALYAFQLLPINYAGLGLIMLGLSFMVAEAFVPGFGVLGVGGVIAFVIGSLMLIDTGIPGYGISWEVILPVAIASALFIFMAASMALKARGRKVVSGSEQMIGALCEVLEDPDGNRGSALVHGEIWSIRASVPLVHGQRVRVVAIDGLTLEVEPEPARGNQ